MADLKSCGSQGAELAPDPGFLIPHPPFPPHCQDLGISISGSLELVPSSESTTTGGSIRAMGATCAVDPSPQGMPPDGRPVLLEISVWSGCHAQDTALSPPARTTPRMCVLAPEPGKRK